LDLNACQEIQNGFEVVTSTEHYLIQADTQEDRCASPPFAPHRREPFVHDTTRHDTLMAHAREDWIEMIELGRLNQTADPAAGAGSSPSGLSTSPSSNPFALPINWDSVKLVVKGLCAPRSASPTVFTMLTTTSHHRTPHTAHRTPHTAHRTPHTAHRTPHTAHRTPHTDVWVRGLATQGPVTCQLSVDRQRATTLPHDLSISMASVHWQDVFELYAPPPFQLPSSLLCQVAHTHTLPKALI
jgi:hypothetical protein